MTEVSLTGEATGSTTTVAALLGNLPEMLGALGRPGLTTVAICEFADHRYIQFWLGPNAEVIGEVISNLNIDGALALSEQDETRLGELGFAEPAPGPNPNWWIEATPGLGLLSLCSVMSRAVIEVLGEHLDNPVEVRTFEVRMPGLDVEQAREITRRHVVDDDGLSTLY